MINFLKKPQVSKIEQAGFVKKVQTDTSMEMSTMKYSTRNPTGNFRLGGWNLNQRTLIAQNLNIFMKCCL